MRTVFIAFYEAYPPASGATSVTYNCVKYARGERLLIQAGRVEKATPTGDGVNIVSLKWPAGRVAKLARLQHHLGQTVRYCRDFAPAAIVLEGASWALYHLLLLRQLRHTKGPSPSIVYHSHNVE